MGSYLDIERMRKAAAKRQRRAEKNYPVFSRAVQGNLSNILYTIRNFYGFSPPNHIGGMCSYTIEMGDEIKKETGDVLKYFSSKLSEAFPDIVFEEATCEAPSWWSPKEKSVKLYGAIPFTSSNPATLTAMEDKIKLLELAMRSVENIAILRIIENQHGAVIYFSSTIPESLNNLRRAADMLSKEPTHEVKKALEDFKNLSQTNAMKYFQTNIGRIILR